MIDDDIIRLTRQQRLVMEYIEACQGNLVAPTTRQIAEVFVIEEMTYDQAHAVLARLEKRDLVRRRTLGRTRWELTDYGREALAA